MTRDDTGTPPGEGSTGDGAPDTEPDGGSGNEDPGDDGSGDRETTDDDRCDFCRLPIPGDPVTTTADGEAYGCCSAACRDALLESAYVFTEHHGHRRVTPGVSALDASLPQGVPRNAFVLLSGEAGTRDRALGAELIWRTLQRGEPAVVVSFQEPPGSVVQQFLTLDWNVLPYLESGQLHIVDCLTYRVANRDRMFDRMDDWNRHLHGVAREATTTIRNPSDLDELGNKLDNALKDREMVDTGMVLIDSLTELGTLVQPIRAYDFVKDLRADVCKGRFVPVFAGATRAGGQAAEFPHDLSYVADGLIDLRLNDELVPDTLIKQARIRKLNGVLVVPKWYAYEYTSRLGMVTFDPDEEMREEEIDDGGGGASDRTANETDGGSDSDSDSDSESGSGNGDPAGGDPAGPGEPDEGAVASDGHPDG